VKEIDPEGVTIASGLGEERLAARTVLWAAGVEASPLGRSLAAQTGAEMDRAGRLTVAADCSLPSHPEIFVIGDLANYHLPGGGSLPGLAPVAMQQGKYVANVIESRLRGRPCGSFHYQDKGTLATIGRQYAVAQFGRFRFHGLLAWLLWLFVHLLYLVGYQSRVLVAIQWAFNYFSHNRNARLILGGR
jgi:NADH dehydrogenase